MGRILVAWLAMLSFSFIPTATSDTPRNCAQDDSKCLPETPRLVQRNVVPIVEKSRNSTKGAPRDKQFLVALARNLDDAKKTIDDTERGVLQSMAAMITDTSLPQLPTEKTASQAELDTAFAAIASCDTRMSSATADETTMQAARATHYSCRTQEAIDLTQKVADCQAQDTWIAALSNPPSCALPALVVSGEVQGFLYSLQKWSSENYALYIQKTELCQASFDTHAAQKLSCDTAQGSFEENFCSWTTSLTTSCEQYLTCHGAAVSNYNSVKSNVQTTETAFKQEYTALKEIECFVNVLLGQPSSYTEAMTQCTVSTYGTSSLDVVYPADPSAGTCETSLADSPPCTEQFVSSEYSGMAAEAPATTCKYDPSRPCLTPTPVPTPDTPAPTPVQTPPPTPVAAPGDYLETAYGTSACPSGSQAIADEEACREAATAMDKKGFSHVHAAADVQPGCWSAIDDERIWWNTNTAGVNHERYSSICGVQATWQKYDNYCVSAGGQNSVQTAVSEGDGNKYRCLSECMSADDCSGFEWYEAQASDKCHLILGADNVDQPAAGGKDGNRYKDAECYVMPTAQ